MAKSDVGAIISLMLAHENMICMGKNRRNITKTSRYLLDRIFGKKANHGISRNKIMNRKSKSSKEIKHTWTTILLVIYIC